MNKKVWDNPVASGIFFEKMKVYFIASPRGVKKFGDLYKKAYQIVNDLGHTNVDDFIVNIDPKKFFEESYDYRVRHFKRVMKSIKDCDVAVVEVSIHSMTVGYIVDKAVGQGKQVIVLHGTDFEPYFFSGIQNDKLQICEYNKGNLKKVLTNALAIAKDQLDCRFTMLLSPKIMTYLDDVVEKRKIPRSVFIRNLIEKEMGR